jgi:hypothetical protein
MKGAVHEPGIKSEFPNITYSTILVHAYLSIHPVAMSCSYKSEAFSKTAM